MIKSDKRFLWILGPAFGMILTSSAFCAEEKRLYDAVGLRDPFVQLVSAYGSSASMAGAGSSNEVVVEGLVYDPRRGSVVILNGVVMREGEEAGGIRVLQIEPQGVRVSVNGAAVYKPMYPEDGPEEKRA